MKKGLIYILISAFSFAVATAFAKYITAYSFITAIEVTFFRFFMGFLLAIYLLKKDKISLRPHKTRYIVGRAIFNVFAVVLFYIGIENTTLTNANMLNMTYPVFVFLVVPIINKESIQKSFYLYLILTLIAVVLIALPDFSSIKKGDLFAFGSAIVAGFAISNLREARKYDDSGLILFYMMGFGTILTFLATLPVLVLPDFKFLALLLVSGFFSVLGQYTLTLGYGGVDAAPGSIASATRIIWAIFIGVVFFNDKIGLRSLIGICFILFAIIGLSGGWKWLKNRR